MNDTADMTILTEHELTQLTGASRANLQIEVLARNGIYHIIDRYGKPKLTWYHVNHPRTMTQSEDVPDFSAMDAM
ncbi:DUF4224 domain-containing protein [Celerinatantimonas sp. MCCC 1A17872]|uniref:DUF4224 domain-containing protein n=1 Tax=Celerinatantimonas sp. MCCC 1A17872 TaxID=3177514 RepID=UPI0038C8CE10